MSDFTNGSIVIGVDVSPPHELNEVANYGHDVSGWQAAWSRFSDGVTIRVTPLAFAVMASTILVNVLVTAAGVLYWS